MGEVYRARDTRLDRTVAVKVLPAELAADPQLKARFEREARAISALAHPNICTLHDVGEQDGRTFLVMEHLVGQTLGERLQKGPLPLDEALEIASQIADALAAAHKQGIVHRDLKPANVMLTKTGARLLDFGLARLTGHGAQPAVESLTSAPTEPEPLTGRGTVMGTLPYMAPEQVEGKPADARTDLWALGAILYEMLTGERAFQASSPVSLVGAILEREPAPLKERQPLTPPSLERLVRRCLAKDPDDRWDTAHDVTEELRWIADLNSQPIAPSSGPGSARRRWLVIGLVALVAIAAGYWLGASRHSDGPASPAPPARDTTSLVSSGYDGRHVSSGHLLFARSGNLLAAPLDLERPQATGEPALVISDVSMDSFFAQAQVATSASGSLAYVPGGDRAIGRLAWVDRKGNTDFLAVPERLYGKVDLAPGGKRVAVQVADVNDYIWIYDTDRGEGRKLTTEGAAGYPLWTPDGEGIAFMSLRSGVLVTLSRSVDDPTPPVEWPLAVSPQSWSSDGRVLAGRGRGDRPSRGGGGVKFVRVDGRPVPEWLAPQDTAAWGHQFSPDGHWVAYASDETGRFEVWVRSYPDGATVRQISLEGGVEPVWCENCDELFYRKGNQWMSTAITLQPELSWETPRLAFETEFTDTPGRSYDVSPDGQRLLVVKSTREPTRTKIHVVHNWFEELKRLVPTD